MKVVLLICFALAGPAICADEALTADLMDFVNLLDMDEIGNITLKYYDDPEFLAVLDYVFNAQEFKDILVSFETIPEYIEFMKYLDESGLDVYGYLRMVYDVIGLPPPSIPYSKKSTTRSNRSVVKELRDEIRQTFPREEIRALHEEKLMISEAFKYFSDRVYAPEASTLHKNLRENPEFSKSIDTLNENGLEIGGNLYLYAELFGFK